MSNLSVAEYIYYTLTGYNTIKFGKTSNLPTRQRAHYTSSPFLLMHAYQVNDCLLAEKELTKLAINYKFVPDLAYSNNYTADEHYTMSEQQAIELCETVQKKYNKDMPLDHGRTYCVGCKQVAYINTLNLYDGFRCKRCFERLLKQHYEMFI